MTNGTPISIPECLKKDEFRFIRLHAHSKKPIDPDWQKTNNYRYDDPILLDHIKAGGNYGIATGFGGLCVIDGDSREVCEKIQELLPTTFTIKSGSSKKDGKHFYYICIDMKSPIRLKKEKSGDIGDVQWYGKQVVGPTSIHPDGNPYIVINDAEIATVTAEQIRFALAGFTVSGADTDVGKKEKIGDLKITDIVDLSQLKRVGLQLQGSHPLHGSVSGVNFCVNEEKNVWRCFRCDSGGGPLSWIAVREGILECHDAVKGGLRGEKYLKTLDILKTKYGLKFETKTENKLKFLTSHLTCYDAIDGSLPLFGDCYKIIRKLLWYSLHGAILRKIVRFGRIEADTRQNVCVFTLPGKGKNEMKFFVKNIIKRLNMGYIAPTSYHPEALVGKVVERDTFEEYEDRNGNLKRRKVKEKIKNYGHLSEQFIIFDEATKFLTSQKDIDIDSRNYVKTALSVPLNEKNEVVKRNVDELKIDTLSYFPDCTIWLLTQPVHLQEWLVGDGTLRRFHLVYLDLKLDEQRLVSYKKRTEPVDQEYLKKLNEKLCTHMLEVSRLRNKKIEFEDGFKDLFDKLVEALTLQCTSQSAKERNFYNSLDYTIHNQLLSMAAIQTFSRYSNKVSLDDLKLAFIDLVEFLDSSLKFIIKFVTGNLSFEVGWHGAKGKDLTCLQWLLEVGARNELLSTTSIPDYEKHIGEIFGVKEEGARKIYYKHKENGWIDSKRHCGDDSSKVWLAFESEQGEATGRTGLTGTGNRLKTYFEILDFYEEISKRAIAIPILPKNESSNVPVTVGTVVPVTGQQKEENTDNSELDSAIDKKLMAMITNAGENGITSFEIYAKATQKLAMGKMTVDAFLDKKKTAGEIFETQPGVFRKT